MAFIGHFKCVFPEIAMIKHKTEVYPMANHNAHILSESNCAHRFWDICNQITALSKKATDLPTEKEEEKQVPLFCH